MVLKCALAKVAKVWQIGPACSCKFLERNNLTLTETGITHSEAGLLDSKRLAFKMQRGWPLSGLQIQFLLIKPGGQGGQGPLGVFTQIHPLLWGRESLNPSHIFGLEVSKGEDNLIRECANDPDIGALVHTYQPKCALCSLFTW